MIKQLDKTFFLSTAHSTLLLRINEVGKPICEYYGKRVDEATPEAAYTKHEVALGRTVIYDKSKSETISLNDIALEISTPLKGDTHVPSLILRSPKSSVFDFVFVESRIQEPEVMKGYPMPRGAKEELVLVLEDKALQTKVELHCVLYEDEDVIGRYCVLFNESQEEITIEKAMSMQLVLEDRGFELVTHYANWAGEFSVEKQPLYHNRIEFGSNTGSSGDDHNPFFYLKGKNTSLHYGDVYGFNLIYSGNHLQQIEKDNYGKIRILQGISPICFHKPLLGGESFTTPMSVMTYSGDGLNGMAHNFHNFVNGHVIPEEFAYVTRPICYNNWEATYAKFNERKIHALVRKAAKLGIELFVLDDGWFGHRDDDKTSLGDYAVHKKKLPHGIVGLSEYVHRKGMKFGLWFEPEAISKDSDLFRTHPEYVMRDPLHEPSEGRNQYLLDLTNPEVREYLFSQLKNTIGPAKIDYIKWDYNRIISDIPANRGSYMHDYILGLYELLAKIRKEFPNLLMENCASGGGRNDLGMFSYFCQGWVSDDTDSYERGKIQSAMAMGYPQSVLSNHVSAKTNHQLLRKTSLGTKFDVAAIGVLGYELDITNLDPLDEKEIAAEIKYYKENRELFQFGRYDLLQELKTGAMIVQVSKGNKAEVVYMNSLQTTHPGIEYLVPVNLDTNLTYQYRVRKEDIDFRHFGSLVNQITPIHLKEEGKIINFIARRFGYGNERFEGEISGSMLRGGALKLARQWAGTGMNEYTRIVSDFGARIYRIEPKS